MIIIDFSQIILANLLSSPGFSKAGYADEGMVRHMVLNSIRIYRKKFSAEYGELVIACDDTNNWRKSIFPYYKASRAKSREESTIDWNQIFTVLNKIRDEIKDNFPYKVVQSDRAEADDVIGTICHNYGYLGLCPPEAEKILIISTDKDFGQLQKYVNVEQYSPIKKKFIRINNPERFIHEHVLRGDTSDGIPNFLSDDDTFVVTEKRQKQLRQKRIDETNGLSPQDFCTEKELRNYYRNQACVDLDFIPGDIQANIMEKFNKEPVGQRSKLLNYFIKNKLKNLTKDMCDF